MGALWTSADIAEATGGECICQFEANGVSIDSRTVAEGDLFIAIVGDNLDGHRYVEQALKNGAAAALVSYVPEGLDVSSQPLVVVPDTFEALYDLARYARERMKGKIVGVTGSVGKTSIKEMLYVALSAQGKTHATQGNLNNHYGVPLTLCRMPADCDYGVFEMGMSALGEISPLSVLVQPDAAIISTVEAVHLEFFESVEQIADAKAEIFDGLKKDGTAILNRDNPMYFKLLEKAKNLGVRHILSFGLHPDADIRLVHYQEEIDGGHVTAALLGHEALQYDLGIAGVHQARNSLGVLAVVRAIGGNVTQAAKTLAEVSPPKGRGKTYRVSLSSGKKIMLIDDSYNASPAAVTAGLKHLAHCKKEGGFSRSVAILGEMRELGKDGAIIHADLSNVIDECQVDQVITVCGLMKSLYDALPEEKRAGHFETSQLLSGAIQDILQNGDVVLVKGSHGVRTDIVVDALLHAGDEN